MIRCERVPSEPHKINPTMTGGVSSVLIWGQTYRAMLGDKGKPLSRRG